MGAHVINPQQLAMFMPAHELAKLHSLDKISFGGSTSRMREVKRRSNNFTGLADSLKNEGVRDPVLIAHGRHPAWNREMGEHAQAIANGNHRVTAALDVNPSMEIPVAHYDQVDPLFNEMRRQDRDKY